MKSSTTACWSTKLKPCVCISRSTQPSANGTSPSIAIPSEIASISRIRSGFKSAIASLTFGLSVHVPINIQLGQHRLNLQPESLQFQKYLQVN